MQCIYSYISQTNHVTRAHTVAAVLYLQFVLHVMLFQPWSMLCTVTLALTVVCAQCYIRMFIIIIIIIIGTIKRTIIRKVRTETILKLYNTLVLPTFLYGFENWTLTASQRRRIEAAEMKLLRPLAGYTFYHYKTNKSIRRELQTDCTLDKIDEYRRNWLARIQNMPQNRIPFKSYLYSPQGKRTTRRPKKRWREQP